jgi:integrase
VQPPGRANPFVSATDVQSRFRSAKPWLQQLQRVLRRLVGWLCLTAGDLRLEQCLVRARTHSSPAAQTGLRLAELTGLRCGDVELGTGAHVRCTGKGRKERCVPLTSSIAGLLRSWLKERNGRPEDPVFPTRSGRRLSDDAVERRIHIHHSLATRRCPSLGAKRLTPHVLRHTSAMSLLLAGVDVAVIALWLGHADIRSTQAYLHADMTIKERALARTTPASVAPGRYRPQDSLLAFLSSL